jgi:hypothetical protein
LIFSYLKQSQTWLKMLDIAAAAAAAITVFKQI